MRKSQCLHRDPTNERPPPPGVIWGKISEAASWQVLPYWYRSVAISDPLPKSSHAMQYAVAECPACHVPHQCPSCGQTARVLAKTEVAGYVERAVACPLL